jgi:hypothetical protein
MKKNILKIAFLIFLICLTFFLIGRNLFSHKAPQTPSVLTIDKEIKELCLAENSYYNSTCTPAKKGEDCLDGESLECYFNSLKYSPRDFNFSRMQDCFASYRASSCSCSISYQLIGATVTCETYHQAIISQNLKCNNCLEKIATSGG